MKKKAIKKRARPRKIEPNDNVYIGFNISKGTLDDFDEVCKAQFRTRTGQLNFLMDAAIKEHKDGN
jgi:hypothetical protein